MDLRRVTSVGRYTRSIEICILLVNDDLICRNIVVDMLQNCNHEAYDYERAMDALNMIKERRGKLELVITNVERTDANRFGIIEYIEKEFKLRVALMRPDGKLKILSRGIESGVTVYMVKCSSLTDVKNLWENALARERGKMVAKEVDSRQRESLLDNSSNSAVSERSRVHRKHRRNENGETSEQDEDSKDDSKAEKKARVQWSDEMHRKFLEAIAQLGHERAFPKKIVELMNIPGLTREHVASHLQKHRMNLRKAQETLSGSFYGRTSINDVNDPCFPSSHSQPMSFGFQQGSRETLSVPASYRCSFNPEASSKSRIRPAQSFTANNLGKLQFSYTKQNFRVYGDQTKNVLLSLKNRRSSSNANQFAVSSNVNTGFVGLRLTDDGKSVEIGHTGISGGFEINREVISSPSGIYGIKTSFQHPLTFDDDPNDNFEQFPSPSRFTPQQEPSLLPLEINGNENSKQSPLSPLLPVSFTPDQQSLQQLGCIANENSNQYSFSCVPLLMTNVGENPDHCPSMPVSFTTLQQCSLHGIESCNHYPWQQYSPMRFEAQGNDSSDIDNLSFVECTTADPPSLQEPSISVPDEEASMPPLQLDELDCFGVSEDIEVLVGNTTSSFREEDLANIFFSHED